MFQVELLRQYLDHFGWVDRADLTRQRSVQGLGLAAALNPHAGSAFVSPRHVAPLWTLRFDAPFVGTPRACRRGEAGMAAAERGRLFPLDSVCSGF